MNNSTWQRAVDTAGLRDVRGPGQHFRVHDLRHTCLTMLREAGVSLEDRKAIAGHWNGDITTYYSSAEVGHLFECVQRLVNMDDTPTKYVVNAARR